MKKKKESKTKPKSSIKPSLQIRKRNKNNKEYYQFLKLKREFLNKEMTIKMVAERMKIWDIHLCSHLDDKFNNISFDTPISEEHLEYCKEWLYNDLVDLINWEKQIVTKTQKTQSNFYKLIYTK